MVCGQALAMTENTLPWALMGLAGATIFYVVLLRPMMRKKHDPLEKMGSFASPSRERAVEHEMSNLLVELSQMTRQVSAQLDTRAAKLEALIAEADRKIARLESGCRSQPVQGAGEAGGEASEQRPGNGHALDARYARIYAMAEAGQSARQIAGELDRPEGEVELILALRRR
jgi:hypothetical protein